MDGEEVRIWKGKGIDGMGGERTLPGMKNGREREVITEGRTKVTKEDKERVGRE